MKKKELVFLMKLAKENNISIASQKFITETARNLVLETYNFNKDQIKKNFDSLIHEIEARTYKLYLDHEKKFGSEVIKLLVEHLRKKTGCTIESIGEMIGNSFNDLDRFFLSLSQSRRTRAGGTFENSLNSLFKSLDYPFDEQQVINGKPDFLIPSRAHYDTNAMDCIIFTAKRTLRERWRQIVTEGTRGLGFYLATMDKKVSDNQLKEMKEHRIYLVCPSEIKESCYLHSVNVLNFAQFFEDHLDPAMIRWKRNGII